MGRERHPGGRAAWTRALTAAATALAAIVTLTSSLSPNAPGRERLLEALEPDVAQATAHALGVVGGLVLLWLAVGVLHGRRSAGRAAIVVLGVLAVVHTAKGLDYEEAAIGLAVAFALHLVLRSGSRAERTPATVLAALTGLIALAGAYALTLTVTVVSGRPAGLGAALLAAAADLPWACLL
jgi:lysyl-tRNA synthetase class 2